MQIVWRIKYKLFNYRPVALPQAESIKWPVSWSSPAWNMANWDGKRTFTFLSQSGSIKTKSDWIDLKFGALWAYNLHYLDCLTSESNFSNECKQTLLMDWIDNNKDVNSIGWDPYCLSLRLVNIIKWYSRAQISDQTIVQSAAQQAHALLAKREYHIQANHLFSNGKALVFVGAFIKGALGDKCLQAGLKILDNELTKQFFSDGGHYELSPMYHQILMWDICDLINLAHISDDMYLQARIERWSKLLIKADYWRQAMYHTNGELAFFNDCALGIAPPNYVIDSYLQKVHCESISSTEQYCDLQGTGFLVVPIQKHGKLIFDAGSVGPDYQPGHAHADSLSLELSLFNSRVFVNSGTSLYGTSQLRQKQRETVSHNTVEIDGISSSQVWGGFRVAKRANVTERIIQRNENSLVLSATHNGYVKQKVAGRHARKINVALESNKIEIEDNVVRNASSKAVARFYLHPDVVINFVDSSSTKLLVDENEVVVQVAGGLIKVEDSLWFPRFGQQVSNSVLNIVFVEDSIKTTLSWSDKD